MAGFRKDYEVYYFQLSSNMKLSPLTVLHYLEDSAIAHSESVGLGVDRLLREGTGWVLNKWHLRMQRYPGLREKITIQTWPSKFERMYGHREFSIIDSQRQEIGCASSVWIYFDLLKRRPLRIPEHFAQAYGIADKEAVGTGKNDAFGWAEPYRETVFHVRRSDIDSNGHVNNASYVQWMLEGIAEEDIRASELQELEIMCKKETGLGCDIYSQSQSRAVDREKQEYCHRILDEEKQIELAQGRTIWRSGNS